MGDLLLRRLVMHSGLWEKMVWRHPTIQLLIMLEYVGVWQSYNMLLLRCLVTHVVPLIDICLWEAIVVGVASV